MKHLIVTFLFTMLASALCAQGQWVELNHDFSKATPFSKIRVKAKASPFRNVMNIGINFSEAPNGEKKGTYWFDTYSLVIKDGAQVIEASSLPKDEDNKKWRVYDFGKYLYFRDAQENAHFNTIQVWVTDITPQEARHETAMKDAGKSPENAIRALRNDEITLPDFLKTMENSDVPGLYVPELDDCLSKYLNNPTAREVIEITYRKMLTKHVGAAKHLAFMLCNSTSDASKWYEILQQLPLAPRSSNMVTTEGECLKYSGKLSKAILFPDGRAIIYDFENVRIDGYDGFPALKRSMGNYLGGHSAFLYNPSGPCLLGYLKEQGTGLDECLHPTSPFGSRSITWYSFYDLSAGATIDFRTGQISSSYLGYATSEEAVSAINEKIDIAEKERQAEAQRQKEAAKKTLLTKLSCPNAKHPHVIDLGLPSGTKWACCNVGAKTPTDDGGYYAWGETASKSKCTAESYTGYNRQYDLSGTYSDAARAKWGGSWRMPTRKQMVELFYNCNYQWVELDGLRGMLFTGRNGKSIFFPAAGYFWYGDVEGGCGNYWTSTPNGYYVWKFQFCSDSDVDIIHTRFRYRGNSVRPVRW